jgi:hypothetical protein
MDLECDLLFGYGWQVFPDSVYMSRQEIVYQQ